ncbi:MAG: hypothetical protein J1G02_06350 [Clostridiales bacterium]|nr:hypothetical protein [Clostridiales bacterium]
MNCIVTAEDIKNEIGIDLSQALGKQSQYINRWLERQQRSILNHIARYAYGGIEQAEGYLHYPVTAQVIREALIEHIVFLSHNNFIDASEIANKDVADNMRDIAPLAHDILLNGGLLYTGAH